MEIDNRLLLESSKSLNVLYVEDDDDLRKSTEKLFHNFFNTVDTASDGLLGYEKYKARVDHGKEPYDIVITDINMPNMDGIQMNKKIKGLVYDQVIIVITAFNEILYLNAAIEMGIQGFITKPIEIETLKSVFYRVTQFVEDKKLEHNHYAQIESLNMLNIDKKDASDFDTAKDILKDLEGSRELISKLWMDKAVVHERLKCHLIDIEFFRTHYALQVIDYFLSVIRGEEEVGNCPVVFIMLDFLKNKDLPLEDIFMICILFKNTISAYIFNKYTFNNKLFDDISVILDKIFEGVIINYIALNDRKKNIEKKKIAPKVEEQEVVKTEDTNYSEYVLEHDIYELQDLEEDIDSLAISITENSTSTVDDFISLGDKIQVYGKILANYPIFSELGRYIVKLGVNFGENSQLLFEDNARMMNIAALIEGFVNDLIVWRREIFDNNIEDPYFLDQSFFSNVDTIIMYIEYDESAVSQEEDFEDIFF